MGEFDGIGQQMLMIYSLCLAFGAVVFGLIGGAIYLLWAWLT